ncbi:thiolase domain-containing protein [bacterium]|jgi:acetyl-CoA C-acetyltransferase|nr:thiolase domain-containing protein [bacterium]
MRDVAVIGVGATKFGQLWDNGLQDLATSAINLSLNDARISRDSVQSLYVGSMSGGLFSSQEHLGSLFADWAGLKNVPATRVEGACASGGLALRQAYIDVASGMHDVVVVVGAEKMTDISGAAVTRALSTAASYENEAVFGATFPGLYAMIARMHMEKFGTTEEQMALVAVKNHQNALSNPYAQFHRQITMEDVLRSTKLADPIKLLDASPISDGAAALILVSKDYAQKNSVEPVWIAGSGCATDTISLHDRDDMLTLKATVLAAKQAYQQAGVGPGDVQIAEVHDCFTIAELLAIEDLGFVEKGKSGPFVQAGNTDITGKIPINVSGGLKAKGHPIGATGVMQAVEIVSILSGRTKGKCINAEIGLTHNIGGSGGTAVVHIFKK